MGLDAAQKVQLNSVTHSVRASQAVLQYGVGAMVDFPDQTLMTAAPEYWREGVVQIHDERLEKALHVDYFGMPGSKDIKDGIAYARFPEWYFCPKCRRFQPLKKWVEEYQRKAKTYAKENDPQMVKHMKCPSCYQDLVVARIVSVCEHGHIDDFPWVKWVHCQNGGGKARKKICDHPTLTFKTGASSAEGLEGLWVTCEHCNARASLKGAFDPEVFERLDKETNGEYDFTCTGRHPWKNTTEACGQYPRALQRGSSSVYFPVTASSLVIPPYSSILTSKIENSDAFARCKTSLSDMLKMPGLTQEMKDMFIVAQISQYANAIALEIGVAEDQVKPILERKWRNPGDEEYSTQSVRYRSEEYEALSGEITFGTDAHDDFLRESTDISKYDLPYIKNISLIHKIREVQALTGFSRIKPADQSEPIGQQGDVVSVKESTTDWYPAYEVRGEGIFIEFDTDAINAWRNENDFLQHRVDILNENYKKSFIGSNHPRTVTSKYVLLHTISHLLIKQLSFECGYSIASLKERIYCSEPAEGKEMNGILIYTASGDSEGTMGGLVRQGRYDTFPALFRKAIEAGMVCSNDPVCSLSQGQGRDSLNLSACYSCALIPETSCEEFNVFLDRGMIVGTFNNKEIGFFYNQLFGEKQWQRTQMNGSNSATTTTTPASVAFVPGIGTDMRDETYENIWDFVLQWADDDVEIALINGIKNRIADFSNKEKPIQNSSFMLSNSPQKYNCELLWKNSKVAYFSSDNDDYKTAVNSDWTCFYGGDDSVTPEAIISVIKER